MEPLFQCHTVRGWPVITDSRVRKTLVSINLTLDLPKNVFTFLAIQHLGTTFAYKAHDPVREIKEHRTCVRRYIQIGVNKGSKVAAAMINIINIAIKSLESPGNVIPCLSNSRIMCNCS